MGATNITFECELNIRKPEGSCVICGRKHTKWFPLEFPKEWRMCCFCLDYAKYIVNGRRDIIEDSYGAFPLKLSDIMKDLDNIEKLINLVG